MMINRYLVDEPKMVVQIVHGAREHSRRYDEFCAFLNANDISVYSHDLQGHGINKINDQIDFDDKVSNPD